jgi:CheY-like chemotaxis protein
MDEAERAGANAYVAKPFTQEAVKSALARLFPGGKMANTDDGR